jgi:hypothetical protein
MAMAGMAEPFVDEQRVVLLTVVVGLGQQVSVLVLALLIIEIVE